MTCFVYIIGFQDFKPYFQTFKSKVNVRFTLSKNNIKTFVSKK